MTVQTPICAYCVYYHGNDIEHERCDAFPHGIPESITWGGNSHTKPMEGDHGLQFKPAPGFEHIAKMYEDHPSEPLSLT